MNFYTAVNQDRLTILLVDDQKLTARLLKRQLVGEKDLVLYATQDPQQAISQAEAVRPAVILLDLVMPEMDGLTLLKRFRAMEAFAEIPIIMLSSLEESELKAEAFEAGANDYLVKLPDRVEMLARLRYHARAWFNLVETRRTQMALRESERRFRFVTESVFEAIIVADMAGRITFWNQGAEQIFGYDGQEIIGKPVGHLTPEPDGQESQKGFNRLRKVGSQKPGGTMMEMIGLKKDGTQFPLEISINRCNEGNEDYFVTVIRDITERKRAEEHILHQANYDALTDLPNRKFFMQCLGENLSLARRQHCRLALLFIDLDKFKWVNDTLGHAAGGQLLREVSQRLRSLVRTSDTLGRLGGDEFTAILYDIASRDGVAGVAQKMLDLLETPFMLEGQKAEISGSIGITLFPEDALDMDELLRNADMAMYVAKNAGRNGFWFFQPDEKMGKE